VHDIAARLVPPLCAAVALLGLWELWVRWTDPPRFLLCAPSEIVRDAMAHAGELAAATWNTAVAVAWGFALSAVVGIAVGVLLSSSRLFERALYPFTVILQTVPLVAIAPMLVIWLHAGVQAVAVCAFIVSLFPVITNTLSGIRSIPTPQVELFWLYGARPWALLWKLKLPGAVPSIMAGLRIAAGLSVIGAVVGEFVGSDKGLGYVIVSATSYWKSNLAFGAMGILALMAVALFGLVELAERLICPWYAFAQQGGETEEAVR
jgi:NitT/TauT family transport system permease protein